MSAEKDRFLEPGYIIKIEEDDFSMREEDVELYNLWIHTGAHLPFIYFDLTDKDGNNKKIHASKIREALSEA